MKRFLIILLAISCLFLTACSETKPVSIESFTNDNGNIMVYSYAEYKQLMSVAQFPEEFISYDDLKQFGKFKNFTYIFEESSEQNQPSIDYYYRLTDDTKMELTIHISSNAPKIDVTLTMQDVNLSDMRRCAKHGMYEHYGVYYFYGGDTLRSMSWQNNGMWYTIDSLGDFSKYPYTQDTVIGKLLEPEGKYTNDIKTILAGKNTAEDWIHLAGSLFSWAGFVSILVLPTVLHLRKKPKTEQSDPQEP